MKPPGFRVPVWPVALLIVLGGTLRLVEFLRNRPLWVDEAMLALNVGSRSFLELARLLDFNQAAPVLFLWLVKAATLIGGMSEPVLRSVALLAGVAFTWVVWRMVRTMAGPGEALIAAALAAASPSLVYFAAEFKPYGSDALVTALLLLLTAELRRAPGGAGRWWRLWIAGVAGFLLSTPAALVMAGIPLALLADAEVRQAPRWRIRWLALSAGWALAGLAIYWVAYRSASHSAYLLEFWRGTFLDLSGPNRSDQLYTLAQSVLDALPAPLALLRIRWWILILGAGGILLARRHGLAALIQVVAPLGALVAASMLGKYPLASRLSVFVTPCVLLLIAVLVAELLRRLRLREPATGLAGAALMLAWSAPAVVANLRDPHVMEEGRESARRLLAADPALPVYIMPGGLPAWTYYSTDWRHPDLARIAYFARAVEANAPGAANDLLPELPADSSIGALRYQNGPRLELIARRAGLAYREPKGLAEIRPAEGWAEHEVNRLFALGVPEAGIYGVHWTGVLLPPLRAELARRGVVVSDSLVEREAVALRVRFPLSAPPPPPSRSAPP